MRSNELINEVIIEMKIIPKSPLLIKSNEDDGNNINWLTKMDIPYIPGSTLKGLFREKYTSIYYDHLKKDADKLEEVATYDNIFDKHQEIMEERVDKDGENGIKREEVYNKSLEVEKLFGSKVLKGRFWCEDALCEKDEVETRNITPIDRFTGGAVVPLLFEYTENPFNFQINIRNINNEELKILLFIIRDSQNGEIRIGNSKTRGFGEVEFQITGLTFKEYNNDKKLLNINEFTQLDEKESVKIGDKYLVKSSKLKDEFKEINGKNEFVKTVMKGVC